MKTPLLSVLLACAALAGCPFEDKPKTDTTAIPPPPVAARPTPDTLSDDQLASIVEQCQKVGTIVTDDYCKQCSYVLEKRLYRKAEAARKAKAAASLKNSQQAHDFQKPNFR